MTLAVSLIRKWHTMQRIKMPSICAYTYAISYGYMRELRVVEEAREERTPASSFLQLRRGLGRDATLDQLDDP